MHGRDRDFESDSRTGKAEVSAILVSPGVEVRRHSNLKPISAPHERIPMKLSVLLAQRQALLQRTRLANLAFAHCRLSDFASRIGRAQLHGPVALKPVSPA